MSVCKCMCECVCKCACVCVCVRACVGVSVFVLMHSHGVPGFTVVLLLVTCFVYGT